MGRRKWDKERKSENRSVRERTALVMFATGFSFGGRLCVLGAVGIFDLAFAAEHFALGRGIFYDCISS